MALLFFSMLSTLKISKSPLHITTRCQLKLIPLSISVMQYAFSIISLILYLNCHCYSQSDTIYLENKKIVCTVREVTNDSIKFTYPNEEQVNRILKKTAQKIVFKSGVKDVFYEPISLNKVNGPDDWENVAITRSAKEVKAFRQVGTVSAETGGQGSVNPIGAIGAVLGGNMGTIRKHTFRKMKMQCAMSGGNLIHITQLDSTSALYLGLGGKGAEMAGKGIAYTAIPLNSSEFRGKLSSKTTYTCVEKIEMSTKDFQFTKSQFDSVFKPSFVISEADLLYVIGTLANVRTGQFRVISFTEKQYILMHKDKATTYNYVINF